MKRANTKCLSDIASLKLGKQVTHCSLCSTMYDLFLLSEVWL